MKFIILGLMLMVITSCATRNKVVIAHRGAPGYLPEHTLAGVAMAHSWGVDYIEPDVVITKDNRAVVLHDIHLDTTTNVSEVYPGKKRADGRYYVVDFTLEQLKKLNVHERIDLKTKKRVFPKRFPLKHSFFKIPTFEEYIELVQGLNSSSRRNIGIYPELKNPEFHKKENKDIAKITFKILEKYGYNQPGAKIYLQCFYPPTLKRLKEEFHVKMPLVALLAENDWNESSMDYKYLRSEKGIKELSVYVDGIGPYISHLIEPSSKERPIKTNLVDLAHKYNLKVHAYAHRTDDLNKHFPTNKEFFDFLYKEAGVDGIFSDFADTALKFSKGKGARH